MSLGAAKGSILGATAAPRIAQALHVELPATHGRSVDEHGNLRVNKQVRSWLATQARSLAAQRQAGGAGGSRGPSVSLQ